MSSLDDKIETICPTMQSDQGCVKHAEDVSIDYLINEIGGIDKSDIKEIEEKTGITPEGLVALGVAGMVTTELLPSQINYEFEQGKFSSVIGLKDKKFNPYLLFNFDENILEINALSDASISSEITIPVKGIQTASFSVVVMPIDIKEDEKDETGIQNLKASFKLSDNSKLTVAYKFNENKETSVYYTKDIGPVSTSVGILGSEEFSSIMANLDLIKVFN